MARCCFTRAVRTPGYGRNRRHVTVNAVGNQFIPEAVAIYRNGRIRSWRTGRDHRVVGRLIRSVVQRHAALTGELGDGGGIGGCDAPVQGQPGYGAVHDAGIEKAQAQHLSRRTTHGAFARRHRPVDGDRRALAIRMARWGSHGRNYSTGPSRR